MHLSSPERLEGTRKDGPLPFELDRRAAGQPQVAAAVSVRLWENGTGTGRWHRLERKGNIMDVFFLFFFAGGGGSRPGCSFCFHLRSRFQTRVLNTLESCFLNE